MERLIECVTFRVAERHFLFAVPTSALFEVPEAVRRIVDSGELAGVDTDLLDELRGLRLLAGGPDNRLQDRSPTDDRLGTLVLMVSKGCNLRCAYCYTHPHEARSAPDLMSPDLAVQAVEFLFERLPGRGPAGITFFGGEPLLNLPAIRAAAARAQTLAARDQRPIRFSITTNAVAVDERVAEMLGRLGARVTVSIDGDPEAHDRHRRTADGSGSYAAAVAGLGPLLRQCDVTARATATRHNHDPVRIVEHLLSLGFTRAGVATADAVDGPLALDAPAFEALDRGMEALAERYLEEALAGRHYGFSNMDGLLRSLYRGANRDHPCGAGLRLAACDTDGRLYLCHRLVGDPSSAIGSLEAPDDGRRATLMEELSLEHRGPCASCWARYLCGGGCYHARQATGPAQQMTVCPSLRRWMRKGLEVYAVLSTERPRFLTDFIDPVPPCAVE